MDKFNKLALVAVEYQSKGKLSEAKKIYKELLNIQQKNPQILRLMGTIEYELKNYLKSFAFLILALMSVYHFYASGFGTIREILHRGIHISFVVGLVFIFYSWKKIDQSKENFKTPYIDIILSILVVISALYLPLLPPEVLASRVGNPESIEIIMGSFLIVLTLEAARRSIGFTLPFICVLFILFAIFGPYFPGALKHGGASWVGFVNHIFDTHEELMNGAMDLDKEIASNSPLVIKGVKMMLDKGEELTADQSLDLVRMWSTSFLTSEDLKEGIFALMEKRKPKFKGK